MAVRHHLEARRGKAFRVAAGTPVRVINSEGGQVVDTWAFNALDLSEFMSMEHSRVHMGRVAPIVGSVLLSNRRRPMIRLIADTSGGVHDTLMAACDVHRYRMLGASGYHDNCTDNLQRALADLDLSAPETPCPLNLFQNSAITPVGRLAIAPPVAPAGSSVTLEVLIDAIVVFSACPQDMAPTNGADMRPKPADIEIV